MTVTIYHNPRCGSSRKTLAMIRDAGIDPTVIEYLRTPYTRAKLSLLIRTSGLTARDLIRRKEPLFAQLGLDKPGVTDRDLVDAMAAHPVLVNRPIVVTRKGVRLCRPPEIVRELL